ncbi:Retrovirus-related Pol polyprotein from transposon TNT 1-94 [Dendrobium catenatum]|uniref:Retrovirus-related Pol polyprotein from transposon TNT 1-94 n=1 Tax=Dendrobium catenatum TaxID=906689 RepID=A0A2I0WX84_9ASPA|nr:Retrovirus-related Pol polyprotein from transposon TNT 1-94 [Dendrobium catenatum]
MTAIIIVLSIVAVEDLYLEQMDVNIAFLHGDFNEELYMMQPWGYIVISNEDLVSRLRRSLYGLK